jgi:hypothetical protein
MTRLYLPAASRINCPSRIVCEKRLLDVNVLAGLTGQERDVRVPVVGCGDDYRVDGFVVQDAPEILHSLGSPLLGLLDVGARFAQDLIVEVAEGLDLRALANRPQSDVVSLIAAADKGQGDLLVGPACARIQIENTTGGQHRCLSGKRSASQSIHGIPFNPAGH